MLKAHHLSRPGTERSASETPEWTLYFDLTSGKHEGIEFAVRPDGVVQAVRRDADTGAETVLAYEHVADVDCDGLNDAFELTNTIDAPWYNGRRVTTTGKQGYRSTSVGDVIQREDGRFSLVGRVGFEQVI